MRLRLAQQQKLINAVRITTEAYHSRDGGVSFQLVGTGRNHFRSLPKAMGALVSWNHNHHDRHTWRYGLIAIERVELEADRWIQSPEGELLPK